MTAKKIGRPIGITILIIFVLCVAAWNGLRLGETLFFWKTLGEYDAHPLYITITGGVWLIIGLFIVLGLWQGQAWVRVAALIVSIGYSAWYWSDRLILQEPHANWPFVLVGNIIFLLFVSFILFSQKTRRYLKRDDHERKPETPKPA